MSEENVGQVDESLAEDALKNMSLDDLKKLMEKTKKQIKQQSKPSSEISPEKLAEIKPFEDSYDTVHAEYVEYKKTVGEKMKQAREKYKAHLAEAKKTVDDARDALNEKRKEIGLKSSRASSAGPQMSWHINVDADNHTAEIGVKDKPETFVTIGINEEGRASIEDVREKLIKAQDISDEGGGRGRGVLNRIYAQYSSNIQKAQNGGTVPASASPEDKDDESDSDESNSDESNQ